MRRTFRVSRGLVAIAASGALMVGALAVPTSAQDPVTFRIGITQAPSDTALNPYLAVLAADYALFTDQYDLLVEFGPNLEPAPGLAQSWDVSADGLTWTWRMRPDVTWSDGQPFTAEDPRFMFQYILDSHDPSYVGPQAPDGNDVNGDGEADNPLSLFDSYLDLDGGFDATRITSITAADDMTLQITTSEPVATLNQINIPILPKHVWQDVTFADASLSAMSIDQAVGTGPFRMAQFEPKQAVVLEARPEYWGGKPHIDELVYQYFDNDEAQVNALIAGEVDFLDNFPATLGETLMSAAGVTTNIASSSDFGELGFNTWAPTPERFATEGCSDCPKGPSTGSLGDPWLTRADVRAALAGLLDKPALIEYAQSGFADPGISVVSPLNLGYAYQPPVDDPVTFPAYIDETSQTAARATAEQRFRDVMAAIGFSDTDGNGILNVPSDEASTAFDPEGAGKDWALRLFVRDSDEEDKLGGELMAQWFEAAGVAIDYQPISESALTDALYPYKTNADADMYMWGWGPDPDPDFILGIFSCAQINSWSDSNYCDPTYDELYRAQRTQVDLAERQATVQQLQDQLYHDSPYAVLWYQNTLEAYRSDRWEGFNGSPAAGGPLWSTFGYGPYGSRVSVGPIGAAGGPPVMPSPGASAAP
ncbi:MAG: peptide ABC transporter substrate-binding protein [Chloroflexi bacterium]|nr:peptide ABC transporter substrate-binding protein [Chloroflexota bacterium]